MNEPEPFVSTYLPGRDRRCSRRSPPLTPAAACVDVRDVDRRAGREPERFTTNVAVAAVTLPALSLVVTIVTVAVPLPVASAP